MHTDKNRFTQTLIQSPSIGVNQLKALSLSKRRFQKTRIRSSSTFNLSHRLKNFSLFIFHFSFALLCFSTAAHAQWTTQTLSLEPGWNAIYLQVDPHVSDPAELFSDPAIKSVWYWNQYFSSVQFIQDPANLLPDQDGWLVYLPDNPSMSTLGEIQGSHTYLIEVDANAADAISIPVIGRPIPARLDCSSQAYSLVGLPVDPDNKPMFTDFFADSAAHQDLLRVYRLNTGTSAWQEVTALQVETIEPYTAYWIYAQTASDFFGPIELDLEQRRGLFYGEDVVEQTLTLRNAASYSKTLALELLPSDTPPSGAPTLVGPVPLAYWKVELDESNGSLLSTWEPLPTSLQQELSAGETWTLRLQVLRSSMSPTSETESYQSLLSITDGEGSQHLIPVSAKKPATASNTSARAGLWVGTATLNKVSEPNNPNDPNLPVPTATEATLQLIIHVDANGTAKLLQQVTLMWKEATDDSPGRYVLVTDDSKLNLYSGSALRDGQPIGRRISSVAFAFDSPQIMTGAFGTEPIAVTLTVDKDAELNPFIHQYHPDHDNLSPRYDESLEAGKESFDLVRELSLTFQANDPEGLNLPGWGDTMVGGTYKETLTGIHRQDIYASGTFRLQHVSSVATLNDE